MRFFAIFLTLDQNLSSEWLAYLVIRFACNARMIVDASSNPPVSNVKRCNKNLGSIDQVNKHWNHLNGNLIRWWISSSSSLVNTSVAIKDTWWSSHMQSCQCLKVREPVEVVEWNKRWPSPPFPCCPVNRQCL